MTYYIFKRNIYVSEKKQGRIGGIWRDRFRVGCKLK